MVWCVGCAKRVGKSGDTWASRVQCRLRSHPRHKTTHRALGALGGKREFGPLRPHTGLAQCISLYRTSFRCCACVCVLRVP